MSTDGAHYLDLPGRRRLAWTRYGDPSLRNPLLYLHGFPGSRLEPAFAHDLARTKGLTIIAPDRPGFGLSDDAADRTIGSWAGDARALLDALQIERCAVLAISGGAPYGIATALGLPDRITRLLLVSGVAPQRPGNLTGMTMLNQALFTLGASLPAAARLLVGLVGLSWRVAPTFGVAWLKLLNCAADRAILDRGAITAALTANFAASLARSVTPAARDFTLIAGDWQLPLHQLTVPTHIRHGTADTYVPPAMGHTLAELLPGSRLTLVPEGGHFMAVDLMEELLTEAVESLGGGTLSSSTHPVRSGVSSPPADL